LVGQGLDLGCGPEKVVQDAIGIDYDRGGIKYDDKVYPSQANIFLDLSSPNALRMFQSGSMDYVFSSHCLEDILNWETSLMEWWRVIKPGGHLVLYGPDPEYYKDDNPHHHKEMAIEDVSEQIKSYGNGKIVHTSRHGEVGSFGREYSWQFVAQKTFDFSTRSIEPRPGQQYKPIPFPRKKKTDKECLVIRYGALGDAVMVTPILRKLKEDGYYVVYNTVPSAAQVLDNCPYIDEFLMQEKDAIPNPELGQYWETIGKSFDKVVNLSESVEVGLLKVEGRKEFDWPHKKRHRECNVNYIDRQMEIAGYDIKGENPEMHFDPREEGLVKDWLERKFEDKFVIEWSLSGSSYHKVYPWAEVVAQKLNETHPDIHIVTVGDKLCKILEWDLPNTTPRSGKIDVMASMAMTKHVDLVIGTETGIVNAASAFDTPKIVFLSHSSFENLPKNWKNVTALRPNNCDCYPCHRLIYSNCCPKGDRMGAALCAENIEPERVIKAILKYYNKWKTER
jgi:ADP-heptose:LPS heptosyltransferase